MRLISSLVILCIAAFATPARAVESKPFSIHDMLAMDRISNPQLSPDGDWIVFTLRKTDLEENKGRTDLYLIDADGDNFRQLTSHPENDSNPRWAPDSKTIYFISSRAETSQIWKIRIDGGEAQQITDLPLDVANLLVAPDGQHLAFTMNVFPAATPKETKEKLDEIEKQKAVSYTHLTLPTTPYV